MSITRLGRDAGWQSGHPLSAVNSTLAGFSPTNSLTHPLTTPRRRRRPYASIGRAGPHPKPKMGCSAKDHHLAANIQNRIPPFLKKRPVLPDPGHQQVPSTPIPFCFRFRLFFCILLAIFLHFLLRLSFFFLIFRVAQTHGQIYVLLFIIFISKNSMFPSVTILLKISKESIKRYMIALLWLYTKCTAKKWENLLYIVLARLQSVNYVAR